MVSATLSPLAAELEFCRRKAPVRFRQDSASLLQSSSVFWCLARRTGLPASCHRRHGHYFGRSFSMSLARDRRLSISSTEKSRGFSRCLMVFSFTLVLNYYGYMKKGIKADAPVQQPAWPDLALICASSYSYTEWDRSQALFSFFLLALKQPARIALYGLASIVFYRSGTISIQYPSGSVIK